MKKTHLKTLALITIALASPLATQAAPEGTFGSMDGVVNRFYVGVGAGQSTVKLQDESRNEEGIDFVFEGTDDGDLATSFIVGFRVSKFFALEGGAIDLGSVDQQFDFHDPRDGDTGSGLLTVAPSGAYIGALLTQDIGLFQVYGRCGVLMWDYDMDIRFDIENENGDGTTSQAGKLSRDGTAMLMGVGVRCQVANHWTVGLDANYTDIDGDKLSVIGGSILFDVTSWFEAQL